MKILNYLFIGLLAAGCSGEAVTSRIIANESDHDIVIQLYRNGNTYGDSVKLAPGKSKQISVKTYNQVEEEEEDCSQGIDSAYSRASNGGEISKNIAFNSNWEVESDQKKIVPPEYEHECVFTVRNSDIEF